MAYSKRSENISLFRISLFLSIIFHFQNIWISLLSVLYFIFQKKKELILYVLLLITMVFVNRYRSDIIPIAIVDHKTGTSAIADKIFYQVKIYDGEDLEIGDIIYFQEKYPVNSYDSQIRKNILYAGSSDYRKIGGFRIRKIISERILSMDQEVSSYVKRILYGEYVSDDSYIDIGYGLFSYYFLSRIRKRSAKGCLFLMFIYSLFFTFEFKFFLILIDCICDLLKADRDIRNGVRIMFFLFLNPELLKNPSIMIPLSFGVFRQFDTDIAFRTFLIMISSFCFHESDLKNILFFEIAMKLRVCLLLFSIFVLFIPELNPFYLILVRIYSFIFSDPISVRGDLSVYILILFFLFRKRFGFRKNFKETLLLIFLLALPLHDLFFHVTFIDVGQGDAILIRYPFSYSGVLIDTGSSYQYNSLKKELFRYGIYTIDHLVITHDDEDHNGNLHNLDKDFRIKDVIEKGHDFNYRNLSFQNLKLDESDNDNDNSLVYLLDVSGIDFLFTGDISKTCERKLIRWYGPLHVDVLKVSHHGSKTASSPYFISNILPDISVISTNGRYGHPDPDVIETLERYGSCIFTTEKNGSVSICITPLLSFVKTGRNEFVIMR